jgi:hypothetical protein
MNNFNIILFSMPHEFQVLLGQPITIAYEEIPPFTAAASENQTIL